MWNQFRVCYKKFFDFSGRASKSEYWWFQLYGIIIYVLLFVFQGDLALLFSILAIANTIPLWAAAVRRLHDTDKSGWMGANRCNSYYWFIYYFLTNRETDQKVKIGLALSQKNNLFF